MRAVLRGSITRLKPKKGTYESALSQFWLADSLGCIESLNEATDNPSVALRARALMRTGRPGDSIDALAAIAASSSKAELGEMFAIRAVAETLSGQHDNAEASLVEARALVFSTGIAELEAEVHYADAFLAWAKEDSVGAFASLDAVLDLKAGPKINNRFLKQVPYPFELAYWRGRALELRSVAAGNRLEAPDRAALLVEALAEFELGNVNDRYALGAMLYNSAVLVRDFDLPELSAIVAMKAEEFEWGTYLGFFEHFVFQFLGLRKAFEGDNVSALRCLRRSANRAPSTGLRLLAVLDRCLLMRNIGEAVTAADELDYALRLASQVDWNSAAPHELIALPALAILLASSDASRARGYLNRYVGATAPGSSSRAGGVSLNRNKYADDCFTEAIVMRAEGDTKRATLRLLEAFDIWSELGFDRLRAMAACELTELTGDARFEHVAHDVVDRFPNAPIARRLRAYEAAKSQPALA